MFRLYKYMKKRMLVLACLCLVFPTATCMAAEENVEKICEEDEYVLLSCGDNYAEIYDRDGNRIGQCRAYLDEFRSACTVKNNEIVVYSDGISITAFSMSKLENILDFPSEENNIQAFGSVCLVSDQTVRSFSLYDDQGALLYQSGENMWREGEYAYENLAVLDSGYLLGMSLCNEENAAPENGPVWVSKDGSESRQITDASLISAFSDGRVSGFGDMLLINDWTSGLISLYDLDGNLLMDSLNGTVYPYSDNMTGYSSNAGIIMVMQDEDNVRTFYDRNLDICGTAEVTDNVYPGYCNGFLEGLTYEELGGLACDGFVLYNGESWQPLAKVEGGYQVYADGKLQFVPLSSEETLYTLNDAYLTAGFTEEGNYYERLKKRSTGETVEESRWNEDGSVTFSLGKGYCIISRYFQSGEEYSVSSVIYDNNREECFRLETAQCQVWKNGYLLLNRGVYTGITDRNGNWVIKTTGNWSE